MADDYDLITLDEAKGVLRTARLDTVDDDKVARVVTAVSRLIDRHVGPVIRRDVAGERVDLRGRRSFELALGPVSTVSAISSHDGGTVTALAEGTDWEAARYQPDPSLLSGIIRVADWVPGYCPPGGIGAPYLTVTYTAGRSVSTGAVDERHKEAAALALRNLWRAYETSVGNVNGYDLPFTSYPTFAAPRAVMELLADEWQVEAGFGA